MSKLPYLPVYEGDLAIFAGELRDLLFPSQEETAAYFHLDRSRISRYESANSTPKIGYIAGLARLAAERIGNEPEVQQFILGEVNKAATSRHYRRGRFRDWAALVQAAEAYLAQQQAKTGRNAASKPVTANREGAQWPLDLENRLDLPPPVSLFGVAESLSRLSFILNSPEAPWLVSIDGLGGIGKTSLAGALVRQAWLPGRFPHIAWVSAKQQSFLPGFGLRPVSGAALTADTLIDALLEQLAGDVPPVQLPEQKRLALTELLKKEASLVVIDNLETVADYESLLPLLLKLANPARFLLTSRHSLAAYPDVYSFQLKELNLSDTIRLVRYEAEVKGLAAVANAPETQLQSIYEAVGGNPLALKLVVGQTSLFSLAQVLENLRQARGNPADELYTYIYWQAWQMLDPSTRQVLLVMPLAGGGPLAQLLTLTGLEMDQLMRALQQLVMLSLVQVGGSLEERRYTLHRLTETFLLNEAIQWNSSPA